MANTDLVNWTLLDSDLTTQIGGDIPVLSSNLMLVMGEPGSGEIRLPLDSTAASQIDYGMFMVCHYRGAVRSGFYVDNKRQIDADASEGAGRVLSISGRGALGILDTEQIGEPGTGATTRTFSGVTKAAILIQLIQEAQARGGLANLTYDFTATDDSGSNPWTDSESYDLPVGQSLLDTARNFATAGDFNLSINLSGGAFVLSALIAPIGTDKTDTVFFRIGSNCQEVVRDGRAGKELVNAYLYKWKNGYGTVEDAPSVALHGRNAAFLNIEQAQTLASATTYAAAKLAQNKDPKENKTVKAWDGIAPNIFLDYVMGDTISLDRFGTVTEDRILGIQLDFSAETFASVTLDFNVIFYENELKMQRDLDWLLDQWNTAKDASLLETSFWAALGTRAATAINDMLIYNGYLYICGLGNMGAGGFPTVARYEIATGVWSGMGVITTWTPLDSIEGTAFVVMGGDLYMATKLTWTSPATGTEVIIYKWNGTSWEDYFYSGGIRILQMIPDATDSNILFCGEGMSNIPGGYRYVGSTEYGLEYHCLTYWAGAGTCYTVALYGGKVYAGWYSTSGYTGFMRSKALSPTVDGCDKEFETIAIAELNGRYATKLLNYGSVLLVAYADPATGIAYLGQYNGTTFTVLGTFENAGTDAVINSITTYLTDIYVGGNFDEVNGVPSINRVAKYSGGAWSPLTNGVGIGNVYAVAFDDLDFYAAGVFDSVDGALIPADGLGIYFTNFQSALDFATRNTSVNWGDIGGNITDQADLVAALDAKTSLAFKTLAVSGQSSIVADTKDDTLTIVAGTNITLTTNAGADTLTIDAVGGGGTPAGADTNIQYNDGGAFGGDANLAWNKTTSVLNLKGQGGGPVLIQGESSAASGGMTLHSGNATVTDTSGGTFEIISGTGNGIGNGGSVNITTGQAGTVGDGGFITLYPGIGGTTSGNGGAVVITGGDAIEGNGGYVELKAGLKGGAGTDGYIILVDQNSGIGAIMDMSLIATSSKIFTFPNVSGTLMLAGNNLSDLTNAATARTNLGLLAGGVGDIWVEKAGDTMTGQLFVDGSSDQIQLRVQAHSTQTNYLQTWETSAGYEAALMYGDGRLYLQPIASAGGQTGIKLDMYTGTVDGNLYGLNFSMFALDNGLTSGFSASFGVLGSVSVKALTANSFQRNIYGGKFSIELNANASYTAETYNARALVLGSPIIIGAGTISPGVLYGAQIENQGHSTVWNSYGLYINGQSGSSVESYAIFTGAGTVRLMGSDTDKFGLWGVTPVVRPSAYTPSNVTTDRTFNANSVTLDELADIVGTLIADLQSWGGVA